MDDESTLVFVYNADSGLVSLLKDYVHKAVRPSTYSCNLCAITFDNFGMKNKWKEFIDSLNYKVEFLHRDEFIKRYHPEKFEYPAVFVKKNADLALLISNKEINKLKKFEELISLIKKKI